MKLHIGALIVVAALLACTSACRVATDGDQARSEFVELASRLVAQVDGGVMAEIDQVCVARHLQDESGLDPALVQLPMLSEADAVRAAGAFTACAAMERYVENVNQLGIGPEIPGRERRCVFEFLSQGSAESLENLIASDFMGRAGEVFAAVAYDNLNESTWLAFEACGVLD